MSEPFKRLYRSRTNARLGGVCGGLGEYWKLDPVFMRLLWACATCVTGFGPGIVAYGIAWLIVPPEPLAVAQTKPSEPIRESTA